MKRKLGILATLVAGLIAVIQPAAAQDRYDWNRGGYDHDRYAYRGDRDRGFRDREFREEASRQREWREREWREHERYNNRDYRYDYRVPPPVYSSPYYGR